MHMVRQGARVALVIGAMLVVREATAHAVAIDFNGDGMADIWWHDAATSATQAWYMNTQAQRAGYKTSSQTIPYMVVGLADFNHDGHVDLLERDISQRAQGSRLFVRYMNGVDLLNGNQANNVEFSSQYEIDPSTGWYVAAVGDFDADGNADILWHNSNGSTQVWYMNNMNRNHFANFDGALNVSDGTGWRISGAGDFDGDGVADIVWHNGMSGATQIWYMAAPQRPEVDGQIVYRNANQQYQDVIDSDGSMLSVADATGWQILGVDDFNGDGHPDLLWHNGRSGATQFWYMNKGQRIAFGNVPSNLNTNDDSFWLIEDGANNVPVDPSPPALPAAPTQFSVTGEDAYYINYQWKDNNTLSWFPVSYEEWEVIPSTQMSYLRLNATGGSATIGGMWTGRDLWSNLSGKQNACLKVRAVNSAGYSMFSNVSCGGNVSMPNYYNIGLGNGVLICTPDGSDCSYYPGDNQSFVVRWSVCNNGNIASPALDVELITTSYDGTVTRTAFPLSSVGAGQCVTQTTSPMTYGPSGKWSWQVTINGVFEGSNGMTF